MAFIPWPNSVKVILEFVVAGIPVTVTIATTKPTALVSGDVAAVTEAVRAWAVAELMPDLSDKIQLTRATGYDMTSSTGQVVVNQSGLPVAGTLGGSVTDIGSAFDISFRTPNRGRSGRGRNFVPGLAVSQRADSALWTTTAAADIAADYLTLSSALSSPGFDHTVASEQLNGVVRNPAVMQPVTSYVGNVAIANQRKRGLNSG